tara:strand:+ start:5737 stop:7347 length:1611 start_codon:yes stop_codon:yes gene_type:complete
MQPDKNIYNTLIETIKDRNGKPVNVRVIYATIESLGIRDVDVQDDYGFDSIADLSDHVFELLNNPSQPPLKNKQQIKEERKESKMLYLSEYSAVRQKLLIQDYSKGMFHLLPIALQIVAIVLFGYSLWTFVGFNTVQSTAVVLGLIMGLTATGGFVQAISKQVSYYWYHEDYEMTKKSVDYLLKWGVAFLLMLFVVVTAVNFVLNLYPLLFLLIVFAYAFLIGTLLLVFAPLYTIKRRWIISVSVFAGTGVAGLLLFYSSWSIYSIHWLGIAIATGISWVYLHFFLKKTVQSKKGVQNGSPKLGVLLSRNYNYFLYGTFFYIFIFTDRILAWSSTQDRILPYIIYYDKDYEIGMDLAMLVFFLLAGVLEYSVSSFSRTLEHKQRTIKYTDAKLFNKQMLSMYYKHLWVFALNALFIMVLLYFTITQPWGYQAGFDEQISSLSLIVAILGCVAYLFLTLALLNVLLLFTLNKSQKPLKALLIACVVNLGVGWWFSRVISYEYSVIGILAGSVVFMVLTTRMVHAFFKKLDYNYYAAF